MNILAHIFLSGKNDEIMMGNFMGDFIKGSKLDNLPEGFRKGVRLHRMIDDYTDHHIETKIAMTYFPDYKRYSGIVLDVVFDYVFIQNWQLYCNETYEQYKLNVVKRLLANPQVVPENAAHFYNACINNDWLTRYESIEGIELTLSNMSQRTSLPYIKDYASECIIENKAKLSESFNILFPELIKMSQEFTTL